MKKRKHSQLRKNSFVRLIRWVYKFFKSLFKPKKGAFRASHHHQHFNDEHSRLDPLTSITEIGVCANGNLITVGELFEQVNWQYSQEIDREKSRILAMFLGFMTFP